MLSYSDICCLGERNEEEWVQSFFEFWLYLTVSLTVDPCVKTKIILIRTKSLSSVSTIVERRVFSRLLSVAVDQYHISSHTFQTNRTLNYPIASPEDFILRYSSVIILDD